MTRILPLLATLFCLTFASAQDFIDITVPAAVDNTDEYIFFTSTSWASKKSYLIDKSGKSIKWQHAQDAGLSGMITHDGQILRAQDTNGCCPQASSGGLLQLFDLNGNLNWSYRMADDTITQHHVVYYMDNGNILFLGWEILSDAELENLGKADKSSELWSEFVWEIKPIGTDDYELVWAWHLKDHLVQNLFPTKSNYAQVDTAIGKVNINYEGPHIFSDKDWWHTNALHHNRERDEILINCRSNGETWIIDHSTTIAEAKTNTGGNRNKGGQILFRWGNPQSYKRGTQANLKQYGSHGHNWIQEGFPDEGKIIFFNNGHKRPGAGFYSTVEMIQPSYDNSGNYILGSDYKYQLDSHEIVYGENSQTQPLRSTYKSNAVQLDNGNFMITEGDEGRILEINGNGQIVWEMISIADLSFDRENEIFASFVYKKDNPIFDEIRDELDSSFSLPQPGTPQGTQLCNTNCFLPLTSHFDFVSWSTGSTNPTLEVNEPGDYFYRAVYEGDTLQSESVTIESLDVPLPESQNIEVSAGETAIVSVPQLVGWFKSDDCSEEAFARSTVLAVSNITSDTIIWIATFGSITCYSDKVPIYINFDSTDIEEPLSDLDVMVSPNPTSRGFIINNLDHDLIKSVNLIDLAGRQSELESTVNYYDVRGFPPGLYYVVIETDQEEVVKKIIIK